MTINIKALPELERVALIKAIFSYANTLPSHTTKEQIADAFKVNVRVIQRLLTGRVYTKLLREHNLVYKYRNVATPRKVMKLTPYEFEDLIRIVNTSADLEEALISSPNHRSKDKRLVEWYREIIISLWDLKKIKRKLFRGEIV